MVALSEEVGIITGYAKFCSEQQIVTYWLPILFFWQA